MFKLDQDPKGRGLRCDLDGLFLGREALLRRDEKGKFEARSASEIGTVFSRVYGGEPDWERRILSVQFVANALNKGEIARAMTTAVLMRLPDPGGPIRIVDVDGVLEKTGFDPNEPRDERGRWTNGGAGSDAARAISRDPRVNLADDVQSDAYNDPVAEAARAAAATHVDHTPHLILAATEDEDEKDPRFGIGGNYPLESLIPPQLLQSPAGPPVQFLDNFLGVSAMENQGSLAGAEVMVQNLLNEIRKIDPNYVYQNIEPLEAMSSQGRRNTIYDLQADLAAAYYRVRGDIRPLQEVTLAFMQRATNAAYDLAVQRYDAGELSVRLSREEAIGNYMDGLVRSDLRAFFNSLRIPMGPGSTVRVNNRAYNSSDDPISYRLPDVRVGNFAFDVSLTAKSPSDPQIKGFFNADFEPMGVVIVRPNQLRNQSSYVIWRQRGW